MAAATASALAVGGLMLGGSAAIAAPSGVEWVPVGTIALTDASTEGTLYNQWHFDPDHSAGASQAPNGLLVSGSGDALVMLGNGNDVAKTNPASQPDSTSLIDLANSLWAVSYTHLDVYKRQQHVLLPPDLPHVITWDRAPGLIRGLDFGELKRARLAQHQACLLYTSRCV